METIEYGFAPTLFGEIVVVSTSRGIHAIQFTTTERLLTLDEMIASFGTDNVLVENDNLASSVWDAFVERKEHNLQLDILGTPFQKKVWTALREVPFGTTLSYSDLAQRIDMPHAVRAVASAVARNPLALIIPCHRVIHRDGSTGNYHWGQELKRQLIEWEHNELEKLHACKA